MLWLARLIGECNVGCFTHVELQVHSDVVSIPDSDWNCMHVLGVLSGISPSQKLLYRL